MKTLKNSLNKGLLFVVSILLIAMTCLVLWQVITRYFLKNPATFTDELVRYILIWTGFIGAAYGFGNRQHVSLTFLKSGIKGKGQHILQMTIDTVVIAFVLLIMVYGGISISNSAMNIKTPVLQLPKGMLYTVLPLSGFMIVLYQIINIYEEFMAYKSFGAKGGIK